MNFGKFMKTMLRKPTKQADWLIKNELVSKTYKDIVEDIVYDTPIRNITRETMSQTHTFIFERDFAEILLYVMMNEAMGD